MELVMNRRVVWDSKKLKEIDEAKSEFLKFRKMGYEIVTLNGDNLDHFHPSHEVFVVKARKAGRHVMKILSQSGDDRIVWDKEKGQEAKEAKHKFQELLGKGYKAYSVDDNGKKNRRIHEFDVDAEEILMIPPTAKG